MVWNDGILEFGNHFSLGSLSNIICFRKIRFGNDVLISWECQFFDTDFHFIIQNENTINDNCGEVTIEDATWIGARATILKNTILARKTIVGANSVCSGNYKEKHGEGILIAGVPAKFIKGKVAYLTNKKRELELFDYFFKHQNQEINWNH
jgi:acetyltransferase-like isoleucine patch superfamily enzyme